MGGVTVPHYYVDNSVLEHFGVKGMRWGVRKAEQLQGIPRTTVRAAKKDAKEFTSAKMYYGEGAGNRRKLIKATVNQRSKDAAYKKAFDYHVEQTDMAKRAAEARGKRKRTDVKNSATKTGRGVVHFLNGNAQYASAAAVALGTVGVAAYRSGAHKVVAKHAKTAYSAVKTEVRAMNIKRNFKI